MPRSSALHQLGDDLRILWRLLRGYALPYWGLFLVALGGYLLASGTSVLFVDALQYLIDSFSDNAGGRKGLVTRFSEYLSTRHAMSPSAMLGYVMPLFLVLAAALRVLGNLLGEYGIMYITHSTVHQLRCHVYAHLLDCPAAYFENQESGRLIARLGYNVDQVGQAVGTSLATLLQQGLLFSALTGYAYYLNWRLALIFTATAPLVAFIVLRLNRYFRRYSSGIQSGVADLTQTSSETIRSPREIKIYHAQSYHQARFARSSKKVRAQRLRHTFLSQLGPGMIQVVVISALGGIMWFATRPAIAMELSPGRFAVFIGIVIAAANPLARIAKLTAVLQQGIVAARDLFNFLAVPAEADEGRRSLPQARGKLELREVGFHYPQSKKNVIHKLSFVVQPGQRIALVGSSGAGKSTLISLIPRFHHHQEGTILFDDVPVEEYRLEELRRWIAVVSQKTTLFNDTIFENIRYGAYHSATDQQVEEAARAAYVSTFAEQLPEGLHTRIGDDGVLLSGGQRQRVAIARALLKNAALLILDEATSALDNESEFYICKAMASIRSTVITIAHRISTVEEADNILVLEKGCLVEWGAHKDLLAHSGRYRQLYERRFTP